MDSNASDVVRVGLKHVYPLQGIVVEHTDLHVILMRETEEQITLLIYYIKSTKQEHVF